PLAVQDRRRGHVSRIRLALHDELRHDGARARLDAYARHVALVEAALEARPHADHHRRAVPRAMAKRSPPASAGASDCVARQPSRDASQPTNRSACDGWMSRPSISTAKPTRTPVMTSRNGRYAGTSKNVDTISRHGVSRVQLRSVMPKRPRACSLTRAIAGRTWSGRAKAAES